MKSRFHALAIALLIATLMLSACGTPNEAPAGGDSMSGTIAISGAFALYPMMTIWAEEFHNVHPDVEFDVQGGGAGKGMTDTLAGAVDIGMISREIKPEEESQGAFWVSVTKDAVFPIISAENPLAPDIMTTGITQEAFAGIFVSGDITTWGEVIGRPEVKEEIHAYTRSDAAGAAEMWARFAGGDAQDDLQGIGINGEPAMVDTVLKDPQGIGYSNLNSVFDLSTGNVVPGVLIPPVDTIANGQADPEEIYSTKAAAFTAVANGTYPSPPARFENLATKGKPTGIVLAFIEWILTDGQQYLEQAGYVPLTSEQQAESLQKLK